MRGFDWLLPVAIICIYRAGFATTLNDGFMIITLSLLYNHSACGGDTFLSRSFNTDEITSFSQLQLH